MILIAIIVVVIVLFVRRRKAKPQGDEEMSRTLRLFAILCRLKRLTLFSGFSSIKTFLSHKAGKQGYEDVNGYYIQKLLPSDSKVPSLSPLAKVSHVLNGLLGLRGVPLALHRLLRR